MTEHDHDDHKHGLEFDLERLLQQSRRRRGVLALLGGGGLAAVVASYAPAASAQGAVCVVDASETAGPYPGDGSNNAPGGTSNILADSGVVRSDIRSSFGTSTTTAAGVPLTLRIKLGDAGNACAPLPGTAIYLWHCTQDGRYSLYTAPDENYLRGVQVADADGYVTFTTIFPGCYDGRWPHIHFEIYPDLDAATDHRNAVLTSQFALPADACTDVYANAPGYEASTGNFARISLERDMVFRDNSDAEMTMMTPVLSGNIADGYVADVTVGIAA
ncbi:MAG TPA: intradiol ring-cleavage dioxygenase [Devosia sp.]|jgi:protocatechuate 3,4-dioxygenase beta subunit|nr:intradiol ring-cleavage dioxygenase [Devosia sp.]